MECRLALLLLSGVVVMNCVTVHHHHHHFVFVDKNKSWEEGQQYCKEKYNTDLATIGNMEDVQVMRTSAKGYRGLAWIGLHQSGEPSWKWSLAEEGSYNLQDTGFTAWAPPEPNGGDREECGEMTKNGQWNDKTCTAQHYPMCYDGPTETYALVPTPFSWREAQRYCREHHTDLASVKNQEELDEIKKQGSGKYYWIGLFRDDWVWSDQNKSSFRYWRPGVPNNQGNDNCAGAWLTDEYEGRWGDRKCDEQHPFFCRSDDLVLVSREMTWREAFAHCDERDMYLVSIFTEEMEQRVMEVAKAASTSEVWVGLRYLCVLEMWIWSTGETVCYDNWAPEGQVGMEKCREWQQGRTGAVNNEGTWVSRPENEKRNFICATRDAM